MVKHTKTHKMVKHTDHNDHFVKLVVKGLKSDSHLALNFGFIWFNALFVLAMYKKRLDLKHKANFKIYDVTTWLTNNYNTHIIQYLTK